MSDYAESHSSAALASWCLKWKISASRIRRHMRAGSTLDPYYPCRQVFQILRLNPGPEPTGAQSGMRAELHWRDAAMACWRSLLRHRSTLLCLSLKSWRRNFPHFRSSRPTLKLEKFTALVSVQIVSVEHRWIEVTYVQIPEKPGDRNDRLVGSTRPGNLGFSCACERNISGDARLPPICVEAIGRA